MNRCIGPEDHVVTPESLAAGAGSAAAIAINADLVQDGDRTVSEVSSGLPSRRAARVRLGTEVVGGANGPGSDRLQGRMGPR